MDNSYINFLKKRGVSEEEWNLIYEYKASEYLRIIIDSFKAGSFIFFEDLFIRLIIYYSENILAKSKIMFYLEKGAIIYRARIYTESDADKRYELVDEKFQGYDEKNSFVPEKSFEGRCNFTGVSFLYAAENVQTCIAEVNPCLEEYVSIAEIEILNRLSLFNISNRETCVSENKKMSFMNSLFMEIKHCFSKVVKPNEKGEYLFCQQFCLLIKYLGYDGVVFESSKNIEHSKNYTIFNYNDCNVRSSRLYKINNITYDWYKL